LGVLFVGSRASDVLPLGLRRLELRLRLVEDDQARKPGPDLDTQKPDLFLIRDDRLVQDFRLRIEQTQRVVELRDVGLHGQPDHRLVVKRCDGLRSGGLKRSPDAAPDVELVRQVDRNEPVVDRRAGLHRRARQRTRPIPGQALAPHGRIDRDRWIAKAGSHAGERARLVDARDSLPNCLIRGIGHRDQRVEIGIAIEPPPLFRNGRLFSSGRRRLEGGGLLDRRTRVLRPDHAAAETSGGRQRCGTPKHVASHVVQGWSRAV
jgi:hypothetical protein